jgi:hypothetical protein
VAKCSDDRNPRTYRDTAGLHHEGGEGRVREGQGVGEGEARGKWIESREERGEEEGCKNLASPPKI